MIPPMTETASSPLNTLLVCGFLGAGKTTFILEQLKSARGRTAVLVNEFGALGIDGSLIRCAEGIDVVELPGGCICCSRKDGLQESIRTIREEIRPDRLLIEPSGIAEVSEVLKVLADETLAGVIRLDAVVTILDASTFLDFSDPEAFGTFFLDQVINADLVVVNKADIVSPAELDQVTKRLFELNPAALEVQTAFCRMEEPLPSGRDRELRSFGRTGPTMECVSVVPGMPLSEQQLNNLTSALSEGRFGRVFRGKGFLPLPGGGWINLQIVGRTLTVTPLHDEVQSRLTLIGCDLDGNRVREFFGSNGGTA
jgi:G3E family GTPase